AVRKTRRVRDAVAADAGNRKAARRARDPDPTAMQLLAAQGVLRERDDRALAWSAGEHGQRLDAIHAHAGGFLGHLHVRFRLAEALLVQREYADAVRLLEGDQGGTFFRRAAHQRDCLRIALALPAEGFALKRAQGA